LIAIVKYGACRGLAEAPIPPAIHPLMEWNNFTMLFYDYFYWQQ